MAEKLELLPRRKLDQFSRQLFDGMLHNKLEQGWPFFVGDPEIWKYSDRLLRKDGAVLDLGIGWGRSSMFFALHGMQVHGIDKDDNPFAHSLARISKAYNLPISVEFADLATADLGDNRYDVTMLGQFFVHFFKKQAAFEVLDRAIEATKPGGYVWLRTSGQEDDNFEKLKQEATYDPNLKVNDEVYLDWCGCSGQLQLEPRLFFRPTDLLYRVLSRNMTLVHTEVLPRIGMKNIMYAEDDLVIHPMAQNQKSGVITILAQKC